ncbi:IclR family transcriptional regulator [Verminephrobacter eiseniae]|nr:IclR family transcriptional regulator [Verminephrobacter eiseniae]
MADRSSASSVGVQAFRRSGRWMVSTAARPTTAYCSSAKSTFVSDVVLVSASAQYSCAPAGGQGGTSPEFRLSKSRRCAMAAGVSTRALTRDTGTFVRSTPGSQSLERGLQLLRAFRRGVGVLTNAELADRTGLPRPTVSRLMRSLVDAGFLAYDGQQKGYRLTAACLSLALSYRSSQRALEKALPLMRQVAQGRLVNVGLAVADQLEMVYLDSVRLSRPGLLRRICPGSRIPIASTSLGCAFLAGMQQPARLALLAQLERQHGAAWPRLKRGVDAALQAIRKSGYCIAQWQAGMAAVAAPLHMPGGGLYALNVSFPSASPVLDDSIAAHAGLLLALVDDIRKAWDSDTL